MYGLRLTAALDAGCDLFPLIFHSRPGQALLRRFAH
jgi:hypothetical protein